MTLEGPYVYTTVMEPGPPNHNKDGFLVPSSIITVVYSRSPKVGNPIASILKSNVKGILALFVLNLVSNFWGSTVYAPSQYRTSADKQP